MQLSEVGQESAMMSLNKTARQTNTNTGTEER
jgi:hypothetical protein